MMSSWKQKLMLRISDQKCLSTSRLKAFSSRYSPKWRRLETKSKWMWCLTEHQRFQSLSIWRKMFTTSSLLFYVSFVDVPWEGIWFTVNRCYITSSTASLPRYTKSCCNWILQLFVASRNAGKASPPSTGASVLTQIFTDENSNLSPKSIKKLKIRVMRWDKSGSLKARNSLGHGSESLRSLRRIFLEKF